jgi:CheY-like chemotaxis protein
MAVVLLSADLMGASRVEGAARLAGVEYFMVGSVDAAVESCAARSVTLVAVDLATPRIDVGTDVGTLVERLKRAEPAPFVVAFGPHVHEAALQAAKSAGCDAVLSRGQFMSQVDALVRQHAPAAE